MKKILSLILILTVSVLLVGCESPVEEVRKVPVISGTDYVHFEYGQDVTDVDFLEGVTAVDAEDGTDVTASIVVTGVDAIDTSVDTPTRYAVKYSATSTKGIVGTVNRIVQVSAPLANGWYNYRFATADTRHTFFAAAEEWLLTNGYGGIPIANRAAVSIRHERINLPVDDFIPSFGWGVSQAEITMDDAEVATANGDSLDVLGTPAVAGNYTYRTWTSLEPTTLNYWTGESTTESDFGSYVNGSFYTAALNDIKDGWQWVPSLAASNPVAINPTTVNGKQISTTWEITLRDDLQWAYNAGTDVAALTAKNPDHAALTADDYIYTFRLALDQQWMRASSGGGDFVSNEIAGALEYVEAKIAGASQEELDALWENFGITKVDDNTLRFEFLTDRSEYDVKYSTSYPAVHQDIFELNPELYGDTSNNAANIASSGGYTITYWEDGVGSRYAKNELHPRASENSWTHETIKIWPEENAQNLAFEAFEDGLLDLVDVPADKVEEYETDHRVLREPTMSIWTINFNMSGLRQQELFPGSTYTPNPILSSADFRMALYFSLDRDKLIEYDPRTYPTNMLFSQAYYVDPEGGVPYRNTPQGMAVGDALSQNTNGYDYDLAQQLFKSAIADEVANRRVTSGTAANPTIIELEYLSFDEASGAQISDHWGLFFEHYAELLYDDVNHVKLDIIVNRMPADNVYDRISLGEYELALAITSGGMIELIPSLEIYSSNNRSGFKLNNGFDSNSPQIEVEWTEGEEEYKYTFSFDAICEILRQNTLLDGGVVIKGVTSFSK